jgi:hypothetical protein
MQEIQTNGDCCEDSRCTSFIVYWLVFDNTSFKIETKSEIFSEYHLALAELKALISSGFYARMTLENGDYVAFP